MTEFFRTFRRSLFLRLLLIFSGTVVLFVVILAVSMRFILENRQHEWGALNYLEHFGKAIVSDIGTPPDLSKASVLIQELPISLVITGPDLLWQSDTQTIDLQHIGVMHSLSDTVKVVRSKRTKALQVTRGEFEYYLFRKADMISDDDSLVAYIAFLLALFFNYWLVRRLLKPIHLLKDGAERISQGELDYRVRHTRHDELGDLTSSINSMADSLQGMLAAKQQLLLAISHELRTPITRAKVQLELLEDPRVKESLLEDINELDQLVTELLEAERLNSQHTSLSLEPLPIAQFVAATVEQYWPKNPLIRWLPVDHNQDKVVNLDRLRFGLLLRNLIGNALRYGEQRPIFIEVEYSEGNALLSVKDQGEGIAAEHIGHLTEPFYRADSARQRQTGGFGLGLYLCKLIVEAHGGILTLDSTPGEGTSVLVSVPLSEA